MSFQGVCHLLFMLFCATGQNDLRVWYSPFSNNTIWEVSIFVCRRDAVHRHIPFHFSNHLSKCSWNCYYLFSSSSSVDSSIFLHLLFFLLNPLSIHQLPFAIFWKSELCATLVNFSIDLTQGSCPFVFIWLCNNHLRFLHTPEVYRCWDGKALGTLWEGCYLSSRNGQSQVGLFFSLILWRAQRIPLGISCPTLSGRTCTQSTSLGAPYTLSSEDIIDNHFYFFLILRFGCLRASKTLNHCH